MERLAKKHTPGFSIYETFTVALHRWQKKTALRRIRVIFVTVVFVVRLKRQDLLLRLCSARQRFRGRSADTFNLLPYSEVVDMLRKKTALRRIRIIFATVVFVVLLKRRAMQRFRGRGAVTNFPPLADAYWARLVEFIQGQHADAFPAMSWRDEIHASMRMPSRLCLLQSPPSFDDNHSSSDDNHSSADDNHSSSDDNHSSLSPRATTAAAREHLFDKRVTPSDVGNLNRLVIPKQHAEKHFPLQLPSAGGESKGMLLNLEDAAGKVALPILVLEQQPELRAHQGLEPLRQGEGPPGGDVVGFHRSVSTAGTDSKLFIDCKQRRK